MTAQTIREDATVCDVTSCGEKQRSNQLIQLEKDDFSKSFFSSSNWKRIIFIFRVRNHLLDVIDLWFQNIYNAFCKISHLNFPK